MQQTTLDTSDDIAWLRDVHIPTLPLDCGFAILYGNEDWPERLECYACRDPLVTDTPTVYVADEDGTLTIDYSHAAWR